MSTETDVTGADNSTVLLSASSVGIVTRRQSKIPQVQNVLLVWLNSSLNNNNNAHCQNILTELRRVVNDIQVFNDHSQCIQFIQEIKDSRVLLIIADTSGQHIVPFVHGMSQVDSIFFFYENKESHEQWATHWTKTKGVFTEIASLCEALKVVSKRCEQNAIPISFISANDGTSNKNLNQVDPLFIYTETLKKILFTSQFDQKHLEDFVAYCRLQFAENNHELNNINELERTYYEKTPIWWYTHQRFLYPMLNSGLRTMNAEIILNMGFFIHDLHRQIEQLHSKQFSDHSVDKIFTVYRGQGLSIVNFNQLKKTKGGLMSFNSFLSTSKKRDVSMVFARNSLSSPDSLGILFVMNIDPTHLSTSFACIEEEVLFSLHSVFRIDDLQRMSEDPRLFEVNLTLIDVNDDDLRQLTNRIEKETFPEKEEGWLRLGRLMLKIGQPKIAERVFSILLDQFDKVDEKSTIYYYIALVKNDQGEYEEALKFFEKSLAIHAKTVPYNHLSLATSYDAIGDMYKNMSDYSNALLHYEKALQIKQHSLPPDHPSQVSSHDRIGEVYENMGDNLKALSYYKKALKISHNVFSSDHPDLIAFYNKIGTIYDSLEDYEKALSYFEKALAIEQQSLPSDYSSLASSYNNIGLVYESMGDYPKALPYYEKYLTNKEQALPPDHPEWPTLYSYIGSAFERTGDYPKALSSYEKALAIQQQSLSHRNPSLIPSYNNIGSVYEKMSDYRKAQENYEQAMTIAKLSLPSNHPRLQKWKEDLDRMNKKF